MRGETEPKRETKRWKKTPETKRRKKNPKTKRRKKNDENKKEEEKRRKQRGGRKTRWTRCKRRARPRQSMLRLDALSSPPRPLLPLLSPSRSCSCPLRARQRGKERRDEGAKRGGREGRSVPLFPSKKASDTLCLPLAGDDLSPSAYRLSPLASSSAAVASLALEAMPGVYGQLERVASEGQRETRRPPATAGKGKRWLPPPPPPSGSLSLAPCSRHRSLPLSSLPRSSLSLSISFLSLSPFASVSIPLKNRNTERRRT